jgi:hypothetical protein
MWHATLCSCLDAPTLRGPGGRGASAASGGRAMDAGPDEIVERSSRVLLAARRGDQNKPVSDERLTVPQVRHVSRYVVIDIGRNGCLDGFSQMGALLTVPSPPLPASNPCRSHSGADYGGRHTSQRSVDAAQMPWSTLDDGCMCCLSLSCPSLVASFSSPTPPHRP